MKPNRYSQLIERIFFRHYTEGAEEVEFTRDEIETAARELELKLPKNLGDVVYSFRYRAALPSSIAACAPTGRQWIIRPAGSGRYRFVGVAAPLIRPNQQLSQVKVPGSTPGIITRYALSDEQALLAILRYNRLIDIFTGVTCYSLQSHLRSAVAGMGQVEVDEVYIGLDRRGAHYVFPVQAKGGRDTLSVVQVEQDLALCQLRFRGLICRPIGAQFMADDLIALFEFEREEGEVSIAAEKHYRLVPPDGVTSADLERYSTKPD